MGPVAFKRQHDGNQARLILITIFCLLLSVIVHLMFLKKTSEWRLPAFAPESYDIIVPRTFRMERVEIDPKIFENENKVQAKEQRTEAPLALEKEIPQSIKVADGGGSKNLLPTQQEIISLEKPDAIMQASVLESILKKVDKEKILHAENTSAQKREGFLKLPESQVEESSSEKQIFPQFSSLDDLIAHAGVVKKNTAPILMPTDLLFEYDSDVLKPQAAETLAKLGSLIKKNELASFRIEGHTDSFGSDDYNMKLSMRRAEAVKTWLKDSMGLDASRISTVGLGKSRLLVSSTGTVEQQQINRRVEIVISLPK